MPNRNLREKVVLNEITFTVIHIKWWCLLEIVWPTLFGSGGGGLRGGSLVHLLTTHWTIVHVVVHGGGGGEGG